MDSHGPNRKCDPQLAMLGDVNFLFIGNQGDWVGSGAIGIYPKVTFEVILQA